MKTPAATASISTSKFLPGIGAIVLGLTIVLGLGFLQDANNYLHNATHDGRHSAAFPCH
ncbi:CbtB domain-containing protein [Methylobacter luteus]|uniref:CbtB domain-containing protein n=1 Tax=Methylobacter luteus TaxID=415 RepID=UPI00042A4833